MKNTIEELFDDIVRNFEEDGMLVNIPENVKTNLKQEMKQRLCDELNSIRDDMEMDIRNYAKNTEVA